ncbi:MAG: cell division protein ZapA [Oscillospiraceae bacterium]|jgi:cell division protein ZapA|nr:cell division protein ZapA [Oscillospiraceae bacterium]
MQKNTVKIKICGTEYFINTDDNAGYVEALGAALDDRITKALKASRFISMTQAAVLSALEYADEAKKASDVADNLRSQLKDYLEDAAKAKSERDFYKREVERLKADKSESKK